MGNVSVYTISLSEYKFSYNERVLNSYIDMDCGIFINTS